MLLNIKYQETFITFDKLITKNDFLTNYRLAENILIDKNMQERLEPLDFYLIVKLLDQNGISFNKRKNKENVNIDSFMLALLSNNIGIILGLLECSDTILTLPNKEKIKNSIEISESNGDIKIDNLCDYTVSPDDRVLFLILAFEEMTSKMIKSPSFDEIIDYFIAIYNKINNNLNKSDITNIEKFLDFFEVLEVFKEEYKNIDIQKNKLIN
jgi:hypothetical protein